jgi:hypothetical protein
MANNDVRQLTPAEMELVDRIAERCTPDIASAIASQIETASVIGGTAALLDLAVNPSARRIPVGDGPLPVRTVTDVGEVLVWISDGRLSGIEYAWWSDASREGLQHPAEVRFE